MAAPSLAVSGRNANATDVPKPLARGLRTWLGVETRKNIGSKPQQTIAQQIAGFAVSASYDRLSRLARDRLKICVLDAIGCAIAALDADPIRVLREHMDDFGGAPRCSLIGGGRSAPDRAAFYNSALVRYIDFNDSYIGEAGTCHPSDNLGAVLAAAEDADCDGRGFMTALAVAYQVQCRLTETLRIMRKGFDHASL